MKEYIVVKTSESRNRFPFSIKRPETFWNRKRVLVLKSVITCFLVLFFGIALYTHWEDLYYTEQIGDYEHESPVVFTGMTQKEPLDQEIWIDKGQLQSVGIMFSTYGDTLEKGKVHFQFLNEYGHILYRESVDVKELWDMGYYEFEVDTNVREGYYTLEVYATGYGETTSPAVWAGEQKSKTNTLVFNGEKKKQELLYQLSYSRFQVSLLIFCLSMLAVTIVFLFLSFELEGLWGRIAGLVGMLIYPLLALFLVESLYQNPFEQGFIMIFFNYLIYLGIYLICFFLTGRFRSTFIIGNTITFLFGMVNYFVMEFRGIPVCPWDLFSLGTAGNVAGGYSYQLNLPLIGRILCVCAMNVSVIHMCKQKISRPLRVTAFGGALVYTWMLLYLFTQTSLLENAGFQADLWQQSAGYKRNGFYLSFIMNTRYLQTEKPDHYSVGKVEEIIEDYGETTAGQKAEVRPNIIMVMNEAYSDPRIVGDFKTNIDYAPFVNSLEENTIKGNLYVSIFGGSTCNTEYEVLTGNSMAYLPRGSIAYQQYINKSQETGGLVMTLKEQDYQCYAIHPFDAEGWNRPVVYETMGFEKFYDMASFPSDSEMVRDFISDLESYKKIINLYEEKEKDEHIFVFDVTVQNHGGYKTGANFEEPVILEGMNEDYPAAEEYLSLLKVSDDAFAYLVWYFSQVEEPVMLVLFGDHQAAIEEEFYEELYGKSLEELDLEELQRRYAVPFLIWTNYDIEETWVEAMSANYLAGTVLSYAGLEIPSYFAYQNEMYQKLPVLNANGYMDAEGNCYSLDQKSQYNQLLEEYRILHYNSAADRGNTCFSMYKVSE